MSKIFPLYGVVSTPEMEEIALNVLRSGRIAGGEWVEKFEQGLKGVVGLPHVVSTVDMTSALFLALHLAGVQEGDEVLTTAFACLSTNSAIAQLKAMPVWVDVSVGTVSMDVADLESKISKKTKAVVLYHVAGYPGPAKEVADLCKKHNLVLIEDCDNALLATRDSLPVGSQGDFAIYSFYPNRQINATEGGALACRTEAMAIKARRLRRFGIDFSTFRTNAGEINPLSDIPEIGWGMTMNNLCSALGASQLSTLKERWEATVRNVQKLRALISGVAGLTPVPVQDTEVPAYWVFLLFVDEQERVLGELKKNGVMASRVHQRNDIYSGFGGQTYKLPNTDYLQAHIIGVPCGWWLEEADLIYIAATLKNAAAVSVIDRADGHS
ncbi:DegT/DnrJ/EryC1/StrS family aminotransferase [Pseudomonas yamanorum]|jgi:dTDP-4-amino-4,6-dideoxygalactose transaminase|uniref:DegT/DnrJ/EryC1/StrS family aminotransferase n=1 Tax=Pseudomonas yamanorum TaxID=515393 RepID=A0ABU1CNC7_9PSED|nr:DegT/DnrJ/EryC1/StrS family aminotransferase [Pseudomonas yamanorum]MDR0188778.1 DegT/DnrJ/EryC1/StrS family aminotransferase [Pseudomonas yamanorum]SDU02230.1 dTDP-4-amino-4,6-dideoxygalactose transaminase [Pseudomonas yamanorum]